MLEIKITPQFKRDLKKIRRQTRYDISKLENVVSMLAQEKQLPAANRDHPLRGEFSGYRECHIEPDWLLIYKVMEGEVILMLFRTGSHSDLF